MTVQIVRPDAKGRIRHLLKEVASSFNGPPDCPVDCPPEDNPGLLHYIGTMCAGAGDVPFDGEVGMIADHLRRFVIQPLHEVAALLEAGPVTPEFKRILEEEGRP